MIEKLTVFYGAMFDIVLAASTVVGFFIAAHIITKLIYFVLICAILWVFHIRKCTYLSYLTNETPGKISEEEPYITYGMYIMWILANAAKLILG